MKDGERKASARKKSKGQEHIVKLIKSVSTVLVILILLFIMADKFGNITFSSVGLHKTFSVKVFPVSSNFTAFLFSSVNVLVHPVSIIKLIINSSTFAFFFFKLITYTFY